MKRFAIILFYLITAAMCSNGMITFSLAQNNIAEIKKSIAENLKDEVSNVMEYGKISSFSFDEYNCGTINCSSEGQIFIIDFCLEDIISYDAYTGGMVTIGTHNMINIKKYDENYSFVLENSNSSTISFGYLNSDEQLSLEKLFYRLILYNKTR